MMLFYGIVLPSMRNKLSSGEINHFYRAAWNADAV